VSFGWPRGTGSGTSPVRHRPSGGRRRNARSRHFRVARNPGTGALSPAGPPLSSPQEGTATPTDSSPPAGPVDPGTGKRAVKRSPDRLCAVRDRAILAYRPKNRQRPAADC
jgi:hypothetical protein